VVSAKVQMTGIPQMVALLNGFGGGASLGVAASEYLITQAGSGYTPDLLGTVAVFFVAATVLIGALTLLGSLVAFAKLQELISGQPIGFIGMKFLNGALFIAALGLSAALCNGPEHQTLFWALVAVSALLGITLVLPIGGADM